MKFDSKAKTVDLNPRDPEFYNDPYPYYEAIREECPAFFWNNYDMWCFAAFADVNRLLRDKRFGRQILHVATREELGMADPKPHLADFDAIEAHSLLELEPPAHTRLRTMVNRAFVSRQVEKLRPDIEALTHATIDLFADDGGVELIKTFAEPIPVSVIARMLGVPQELNGELLDWSHRMVRMYMFETDETTERDANRAAQEFSACLTELIAARRKNPTDDLISHMVTSERKGDRLSDGELISTCVLLLNAGHEATVHQTGNAVKAILENRLDHRALFADAASTEAAIEESLRYDAPLHLFTRYALQDVELDNGIEIRKGEQIGLMLGAANRDPAQFADAASFVSGRPDQANVTFGAGIHFCIGAPLARLELQTSLPILFERLPGLKLSDTPRYRDAYHFHGLERLDLSW
ncbi:cytochrome P450 [Hoeflea sp. TYP-13]|uniref:cytochrome P450 n=1 Tax=Hoeflea sp. TYP-13 TaxID=3230023 RepID=UPI0034C5C7F9